MVLRPRGIASRLVLAVFACALAWGAGAECVLRVRTTSDPPYSISSPGGAAQGIDPDLVTEIARRIGCRATFLQMTWPRALIQLEAGELDVLGNAVPTAERERFARFSLPVRYSRNVVFMGEHVSYRNELHTLRDLIGTEFRLGVQPKAMYSGEYVTLLQEPAFRARLVEVTHLPGAWQMIASGRLDGQLASEQTGLTQIRELGLESKVRVSEIQVGRDPVAFALSRASVPSERAGAFDSALQAMIADGTYARIVGGYLRCSVSLEKLGCG